jgi:SepF-like predicted cell division protein (DUF552 family)
MQYELCEYDLTPEQKAQFEQEIRNELSKLGVGVEEVVEEVVEAVIAGLIVVIVDWKRLLRRVSNQEN